MDRRRRVGMSDLVPVSELAQIFGVSQRRIQEFVQLGILAKQKRGQYSLRGCTKAYIRFLRDKQSRYPVDLQNERARLTKLQADKCDLELQEARDEVIRAEDVAKTWGDLVVAAHSRLLAIPTSLTPGILAADSQNAVTELLRDAIEDALNELAETKHED